MAKSKQFHGRKRGIPNSKVTTLMLPEVVFKLLKLDSVEQGCSMSWIVTALLMERYGIGPKDLEKLEGPRPPKKFDDRVGLWTPNKKPNKKGNMTVVCPGCRERFEDSEKAVQVRAGYCSGCWDELSIEEKQTILRRCHNDE